ncbi:MAG: hypothetical protein ACE5FN_06975 [Leptospirillia bacterium]
MRDNPLKTLLLRIRQVQPARLTALLGGWFLFLLICQLGGLVSQYGFGHDFLLGLVPLFDFDREFNAPSIFSVGLLLLATGLLAVIAAERRRVAGGGSLYWLGLSGVFLFVSMDELLSFHEMMIEPIRQMLGVGGVLYFAWVIPYGIGVLFLGVLYGVFLFRLPRSVRNLMLLSAVVFLGGALGVEMAGAWYMDQYLVRQDQHRDLIYALITTCEESLEMIGVILFIRALHVYISTHLSGAQVHGIPE